MGSADRRAPHLSPPALAIHGAFIVSTFPFKGTILDHRRPFKGVDSTHTVPSCSERTDARRLSPVLQGHRRRVSAQRRMELV